MTCYQTISIDEEGIWLVKDELDKYARGLVRNSPLSVISTEEQLDAKVPVPVTRFHLVIDEDFGDYDIRSDKQADKLIDAMRKERSLEGPITISGKPITFGDFERVGRALGVDYQIEAFCAGVPLDYILGE